MIEIRTDSYALTNTRYWVERTGETREVVGGYARHFEHYHGRVWHQLGVVEVSGVTRHHLTEQEWQFSTVAKPGRITYGNIRITARSRFLTPRGAARVAARWLEDLHAEAK